MFLSSHSESRPCEEQALRAAFIDPAKAFDMVPYTPLLCKPEAFGVSCLMLDLLGGFRDNLSPVVRTVALFQDSTCSKVALIRPHLLFSTVSFRHQGFPFSLQSSVGVGAENRWGTGKSPQLATRKARR